MDNQQRRAALKWQMEMGADAVLDDTPGDMYMPAPAHAGHEKAAPSLQSEQAQVPVASRPTPDTAPPDTAPGTQSGGQSPGPLGTAEARRRACELARSAQSLAELQTAIESFSGLAIAKTATNTVFSDGHPQARIMIVGEAPGADEDKQGKPFVGASGQLLDRMLSWLDLSRHADDPLTAVYISNILNFRPPGNRTPNNGEIETSLPFIARHIALIQPAILVLSGGTAAKALLNTTIGITKLRKQVDTYSHIHPEMADHTAPIACVPTYHPSFLLRSPQKKREAWADMIRIQQLREEKGL